MVTQNTSKKKKKEEIVAANAPGILLHAKKRAKILKDARSSRNRSEIAVASRKVVRRIRW